VLSQLTIQLFPHNSRLDADAVAINRQNAIHVPREIDHKSGTNGSSGQAGAGSSGNQRNAVVSRIRGQNLHIMGVSRKHNPERLYFVKTCVRRIHRRRSTIDSQFALDRVGQIFNQSSTLFFHRYLTPTQKPSALRRVYF
jgi:hypothetical protein